MLTTAGNRKTWSQIASRTTARTPLVDKVFIICLDDGADSQRDKAQNANGEDLVALLFNFSCGAYDLREGVQAGTCTNRSYDKVRICMLHCQVTAHNEKRLQIIVCADGINFEHTGFDGHASCRPWGACLHFLQMT